MTDQELIDLRKRMPEKQIAFCDAYLKCRVALQAYRDAGYTIKSPAQGSSNAYRLLRDDKVQAYVKHFEQVATQEVKFTVNTVLNELYEIAHDKDEKSNIRVMAYGKLLDYFKAQEEPEGTPNIHFHLHEAAKQSASELSSSYHQMISEAEFEDVA